MSWSATIGMRIGELELDIALSGGRSPVALIGPNGSGKTTVLRTIAGAYRPDRGSIVLGETVVFDADSSVHEPPERRGVGYVPQGYGLMPHLNAVENVAFALSGLDPSAHRHKAIELMQALDCAAVADQRPSELSGGEAQRVALARALMPEPRLLLLDEPLAALDAAARRKLRAFLADHLRSRGVPSLFVTHDARDVRAFDARVVAIEAGRVVQEGTPDELAAEPSTDFVAEFFGS